MQFLQVLPLLMLAPAICVHGRSESSVTPIQKVLEMMDAMLVTAKAEKQDEMARFAAFQQWCGSTKADKERAIKDASDKISELEASIAKSEADAAKLGEEIGELNKEIALKSAESKKAADVRKAEKAEYSATHLDYSESIDALGRAIQVLKSRDKDVPQKSLIQVQKVAELKRLPVQMKHVLAAFLQSSGGTAAAAPEAEAYEFQSTSVIDMLEKLKIRFQDERFANEKEELNKKSAYEMLMQKLTDDINYAKEQVSSKSQFKAQALQDAATAKGDLTETEAAKAADETYLRDTLAECDSKAKDYESRQVTRANEIEAINKAIEIISSPEVSGTAETYLPSAAMLQTKKTVLAQLRKSGAPEADRALQTKVVSLLMQRSSEAKSDLLAMVANKVYEDPFAKVKKMIKDLIVKLLDEANEEADHKAFCDEELATNKQIRDEKSAEVDQLTASIDELTSKNAKLVQEIADLGEQVAAIDASVKEATEARTKEKAANTKTIAEAKVASAAVTQAIKILKDFYAKAATATAFAQAKAAPDDAPETFDTEYKGLQGEKGGVIGMLEVIQSDFARLEAETSSGEDEAAREYETFMNDSAEDKAVKEKEARHKGFDKVRTERALEQAKKDLTATQKELDAALEYYSKLKPQCVDTGLSYAERREKRRQEIASLQEALKVLNGEDILGDPVTPPE
jgi:hypothetical protein